MPIQLNETQIAHLAPDEASIKAALGLRNLSKWSVLAQNEQALWGHCQGSGKTPYQTAIDLSDMTTKCSCPSRKFPCKHALALLYIAVQTPNVAEGEETPDWVQAWLDKRQETAERKAEKATKAQEKKPVDEEAQAKRQASRHQRVLDGVGELQAWIEDLLRTGLAQIPSKSDEVFEHISKRMIDQQMGAVASQLQSLEYMEMRHSDWQDRLLDELSRLYLLAEAYKHLDEYPPALQSEIKLQIGYTQSEEEALATEGIRDKWLVFSRESENIDKLNVLRIWLYGINTGRVALLLSFSPIHIPQSNLMVEAQVYEGLLHYYPSISPLRAILRESQYLDMHLCPSEGQSIAELYAGYRAAVQANPFLRSYTSYISPVYLHREGSIYYLCDEEHKSPIHITEEEFIQIMATTGGETLGAFVQMGSRENSLMSLVYQQTLYPLSYE